MLALIQMTFVCILIVCFTVFTSPELLNQFKPNVGELMTSFLNYLITIPYNR
jgi:hypothetical protein